MDVNTYYTKLKILWDELKNYQLILVCHCGGTKSWLEYQQQEYIMQFLMGLNVSYAQTQTQIFMMNSFPLILKVFALVGQEKRQHIINQGPFSPINSLVPNISNSSTSIATTSFSPNSALKPRRERPQCSHCDIQGHIVNKCYKLHGYLPGYKPK